MLSIWPIVELFGVLNNGLGGGLFIGLFVGLLGGFMRYGGQSFIQHYALRWVLANNGSFPFSVTTDRIFIEFLDAMKDRILLRRVGGGWVFIHRTLLDYFASLHPDAQVEVDHE